MGLGFTCVHREVIERLAETAPRVTNNHGKVVSMMFRVTVDNGLFVGEDMNFFADCAKLGYPLWCNPNISLGHNGDKEYKAKLMDVLQKESPP